MTVIPEVKRDLTGWKLGRLVSVSLKHRFVPNALGDAESLQKSPLTRRGSERNGGKNEKESYMLTANLAGGQLLYLSK